MSLISLLVRGVVESFRPQSTRARAEGNRHEFELEQQSNLHKSEFARGIRSLSREHGRPLHRWRGLDPSLLDEPKPKMTAGAEASASSSAAATTKRPPLSSRHPPHSVRLMRQLQSGGTLGPRGHARLVQRFIPSQVRDMFFFPRQAVYSATYSSSGKLLAVATKEAALFLFDAHSLRLVNAVQTRNVQWAVTSVDMTMDDQFVLYTSIHDVMYLCNTRSDAARLHEPLPLFDGDERHAVWCARFSQGGQEVVAGCGQHGRRRGDLVVYDVERKTTVTKVPAHHGECVPPGSECAPHGCVCRRHQFGVLLGPVVQPSSPHLRL
jgi:hypothetical protein